MNAPLPKSAVPAPAPEAPPGGARSVGRQAARRLRRSIYGAFVALALLALLQAWQAHDLERLRAVDAEILELAGRQAAFTQRLGYLGATLTAQTAGGPKPSLDALAALLERSRTEAGRIEALIARQQTDDGAHADAVARALAEWQDARERLWYRGENLLRHLAHDDAHAAAAVAARLGQEIDRAEQAAQAVATALRAAATERSERHHLRVDVFAVLALLLLATLAVVVVEPFVGALRRAFDRLADQADELQRLALVAERTRKLVLVSDRDNRIVWANEALERMLGHALDDLRGRRAVDVLPHERADPAELARLREAIAAGQPARVELASRAADGRERWFDIDLQPLRDARGELTGFVSLSSDITTQVVEREHMRAIIEAMPDGLLVLDRRGCIVQANRSAEMLLGAPAGGLVGLRSLEGDFALTRDDGSPCPTRELPAAQTLADGRGRRGISLGRRGSDGQRRWLLVNTEPLRDADGRIDGVVVGFVDVTAQRELQDRLQLLARVDALTGLPNRAVMLERVQRAIALARQHPEYGFAVLFMDFDRFKQVNDTMGHAAGDQLLRQMARRLEATLRPGDAVARADALPPTAARIGGDEFVVLLERTRGTEDARAVGERLLQALGQPYELDGQVVQSGVSIGIVTSEHAAASADDVLRDADTAMYEAKRGGRGRCVVFDASMHERLVRQLALEGELREALAHRQFVLAYQPTVDLATGLLAGVEALVRWRHPQRGLVAMSEFVDVAEDSGLIEPIGDWALETACRDFAGWQARLGGQAPRSVAVNLSLAQFRRGGLVQRIGELLAHHGLEPGQLELEVTETVAARDGEVQAALRLLKQAGVRLALDDFGKGYSSLACLHQLPVDIVKIDRSFVMHAETVEYHRVLIESTIRVARTLGMATVAEGIETASQEALLRRLDCDRGQGWLYARPMLARDLEAWRVAADDAVDTV